MSLDESRAIKTAEDGWTKAHAAETAELCGGAIPFIYEWPTLHLGRAAVRGAIKRVMYKRVATTGKHVTLVDGVLDIAGEYGAGIAGTVREGEITALLLASLRRLSRRAPRRQRAGTLDCRLQSVRSRPRRGDSTGASRAL